MKKKTLKKLVNSDLSLNKAALNTLEGTGILKKKTIEKIALKVIKGYKKKYKGEPISEVKEAVKDSSLILQRVWNAGVQEIAVEIKENYSGEFYEWLPSDADEADPEHQLKYGEVFQIGKGEMPGDRYGCRCGMDILVKETKLEL